MTMVEELTIQKMRHVHRQSNEYVEKHHLSGQNVENSSNFQEWTFIYIWQKTRHPWRTDVHKYNIMKIKHQGQDVRSATPQHDGYHEDRTSCANRPPKRSFWLYVNCGWFLDENDISKLHWISQRVWTMVYLFIRKDIELLPQIS